MMKDGCPPVIPHCATGNHPPKDDAARLVKGSCRLTYGECENNGYTFTSIQN